MSTTPQPASPEPTARPAGAAETTDAATPPTDAPETEATPQPAPAAPEDHSGSDEGEDAGRPDGRDGSDADAEPDAESDAEPDAQSDAQSDAQAEDEGESEEERRRSAEEFAAEHDPANHDIAAGEEFRQPGDWTAEDRGPQVWDSEGNLVSDSAETGGAGDAGDADGRRVSAIEEVRDGGYSVGSAATLHDGAMPFGHPVKAWEDTKTFVTPEHDLYEEAEPHVWFADAEAAERAGFRPAD
jgi:hypothetical protein